ncbi:karyogamy protein Kar4p [[Candida] jaroonii]|uniref:Karyogamy protein Kar4p n=1 Tax=[Candida] jaroonii TaxID=467808 RepID=A0ACA9Y0L5_9ASCO|nr:karyogamy protein Kar4p [[Candida] jaroonii]
MFKKIENNFANHYVETQELPSGFVTNSSDLIKGYPKLQTLKELKAKQTEKYAVKALGCRVKTRDLVQTVNRWTEEFKLQFDVIMIGCMANNQRVLKFLKELPLLKLCSKPGFLFIWTTVDEIESLTTILNQNYGKKFRRSEELVFLPVNKNSIFYPQQDYSRLFENQQWNCWMCITGTVRRSNDQHLIHCNIDTDLQFENESLVSYNAVPNSVYKIAENFSNFNRRLHIIPYELGKTPIKLRHGWVILSPDVLLNNFNPLDYETQLQSKSLINYKNNQVQYLVGQTKEIEDLRPKSPGK